ncbi:HipA domain-containing protein [Roseateles saccharophilus]|uniref:Serine/threonine-protein kinase HipA n=1 Tax=Roseateles saccharophilus TaxID=304 RepID=A0A4R3VK66_ROSSA|nr:HipA domain-containing protein [Roseateles saccharophilus]MDG0831127.1 type II toxin-antitoxin system HipA family toxin [Roseateles saccharophilus]TCV04248.1 serine/threonine-protein kinase HipA [Roseateles saccharophilus]
MPELAPEAPVEPPVLPEGGRRLDIFINQVQLGSLHEDNDLWTLVYLPQWVDRPDSFDLSPALPRSQLLHRDGATLRPVQWYFDNLLPEEKLRELIAADAHLRNHDDAFALLEYLGAESAGSLTLLPPGESPQTRLTLKPLPYKELSRRILGLPRTTLTREAPKRMSLAGAQHKMLAVLKGRDVYEPVGSTPSTHILKPDHPASDTYPASTYLEWLTMRLASAAKLATPPVELLHVPQPVYAIERFDRQFDRADFAPETAATPPAVQRVHVIDACQLLNKSRMFKYGAGVQVLRELSQACEDKLTTPVLLFRWLVFNLLVANDDCHLKNLSFLVTPGRVDLSQHYDLLATGVYHTRAVADEQGRWPAVPLAVRLSPEVARFDQVTPEAVLAAAATLGVPEKLALRTVREVVTRVLGAFDALYAEHYPQQEGLMAQLKAKDFKGPEFEARGEPAASGPENAAAQVSAPERAQQLKLLRVLRHIVLPEMVPRVLA